MTQGPIHRSLGPLQARRLPKCLEKSLSHLFSRARKKGFSFFFLWGDPVQNRPQNPAPARCLFSTRKSRSEVPERGDFGEENCVGKCGADRAKKRKKGCTKKGGLFRGLQKVPELPSPPNQEIPKIGRTPTGACDNAPFSEGFLE